MCIADGFFCSRISIPYSPDHEDSAVHKIRSVKPLENFGLEIVFNDDRSFVYNAASDLWGEVFEPLKDVTLFNQVFVGEFGGIEWPNGADYCADALYQKMESALQSTTG